jgi:hypothetical protein
MPAVVVVAFVVTLVLISVSMTVAPGIIAPEVSVTTPVTVPRTPCALSGLGISSNRKPKPRSKHSVTLRMVNTPIVGFKI